MHYPTTMFGVCKAERRLVTRYAEALQKCYGRGAKAVAYGQQLQQKLWLDVDFCPQNIEMQSSTGAIEKG